MHRSTISKAMENRSSSNTPHSGFWKDWFGGLDPLPGDEKLGKQPSLIECFSTLSRKQAIGMVIVATLLGGLFGAYLFYGLSL
ncbi:MAG: hypothetical protein AAB447_00595 [Patescibacteria group bacterium]|mgnify:FL=1